ncbi:MAG TPA: RsmB/NOP family class I SAM-dependent RNA methyltransferase [Kofleriaceae bacterium]|nr:RsmB/NOP family class I SAM-dependent RNA methyltransferase [Kofleriaceae bacterium]
MTAEFDRKLAATVADGGKLRALLLELWQRTRMDWGFVTDRLAVTFRKEHWIGAHERRFVSETLYGMIRNLRRIDLGLERGRKTKQSPRDLERLIALLVLEGQLDTAHAARVVPELDWAAVATVDQVIASERKPGKRIALAASLPDWLAERFVADHGDRAEAVARALNERAPMTVRANTLIGDRDALAKALAAEKLETRAGRWSDTALIVETRTNLFATAAFTAGAFEAQDEGSQLLAELATPAGAKPLVVDYCAGAGGKTLAIAARLANRGRIVATDIDDKKLEELRRRARRAKVSNARALRVDDRELDALQSKADLVFVDAPCTGTGALRRNPESRWRLREDELAGFAARQLDIVTSAKRLLAPGGLLVYATCSVLAAENEDVVATITAAHEDLVTVPLAERFGAARAEALGRDGAFVVTPDRHGTDGFFAQVFRRT